MTEDELQGFQALGALLFFLETHREPDGESQRRQTSRGTSGRSREDRGMDESDLANVLKKGIKERKIREFSVIRERRSLHQTSPLSSSSS
jgi:hypothetical protein